MMTESAEFTPVAGEPFALAADLTLVLAPNPSPMTYLGTNTYLVGCETLAIIDPGPADASHLTALCKAIDGRRVEQILVTHSHLDHSPLAFQLAEQTGAPILAFGDSGAGISSVMRKLNAEGLIGGGEGVDHDFAPDRTIADGDPIAGDWGQMTTIHTPGHIGNHLCFRWKNTVFTGDHVMGWASSLVSPPDGDLTDFMNSCARLSQENATIYYPGHGAPIRDPAARLRWLIDHRKGRERQILQALLHGPATAARLTKDIYVDVSSALLAAAERNVLAHLIDLHARGIVQAYPTLSAQAQFARGGT